MAHEARGFACVRYNKWTEEWLYFCAECRKQGHRQSFWPLDEEFWDPENMTACRKCLKRLAAAAIKARRDRDPVFREEQRQASLANKRAKNAFYKRNARLKRRRETDPEWQPRYGLSVYRPVTRPRPTIRIVSETSPPKGSETTRGRATTANPATTSTMTASTTTRAGASAATAAMASTAAPSSPSTA